MSQTEITSFVSCWFCRDSSKFGYEHCLKCEKRPNECVHEMYPIVIEGIQCKRCWYCGKTEKVE